MTKYRAIPTTINGIRFDSKKEAARYEVLLTLQSIGQIHSLELQPSFDLLVVGSTGKMIKVGKYRADFLYYISNSNEKIIEDVKGMKTSIYNLKKKHVEAQYGIKILET